MAVSPQWAVHLDAAGKSYAGGWTSARRRALSGVTLTLARGQVLGLLGPNGSGKSTTLKMIAGLLRPSEGCCWIHGHLAGSEAARASIGYLPDALHFPLTHTAREMLVYYARLSAVPADEIASRVNAILARTGIEAAADQKTGAFSKGMRQRLGLAQALVHEPAVVLLDEPASGLDPEGRIALGRLIREIAAEGRTVVFSSHLLAQADDICDRLAILGHGRLLVEGTPEELLGPKHRQATESSPLEKLYLEKLHASIKVVAIHTLGEALRLRLFYLLGVVGAGLACLALALRKFNFGVVELKFLADFGLGAIGLAGSVLAALATAQLHFDDLARGTAATVLTRAVRHYEYLAGRLAGVSALLALFVAVLGVILALIVSVRESQLGAVLAPLPVFLQACAFVWLKVTLVAALTLLVCSYSTSNLFASCAGLLLAVIAHLRTFTHAEGWLSFLRLWPNLALFEVGPLLGSGQALPVSAVGGLLGYWAAYLLLLTGLASYVCKQREL